MKHVMRFAYGLAFLGTVAGASAGLWVAVFYPVPAMLGAAVAGFAYWIGSGLE